MDVGDDWESYDEDQYKRIREFERWLLQQPEVIAHLAPRPDDPTLDELFTFHSPTYVFGRIEEFERERAAELDASSLPDGTAPSLDGETDGKSGF